MKGIELLIFDLDGCLVHTQPDIGLAAQKTAREIAHKDLALEDATRLIGGGARKAMMRMLGDEQMDLLEEAVTFFVDYYAKNNCELYKVYNGVKEALDYFKGKVHLAVATDKIRAVTENILKKLGLYDYFEVIICDEDMSKMNPDPECVNLILQKLNIAPEHAVMIGDMKTDVMAAHAAGAKGIGVTYGYGKKEDILSVEPEAVLDNMKELINVIEL